MPASRGVGRSVGLVFEPVHVVIAEAEVMARLMHHHVAHQIVHSDPGFAPFGNQRFAEQPNARRELPALPDRLVGQGPD